MGSLNRIFIKALLLFLFGLLPRSAEAQRIDSENQWQGEITIYERRGNPVNLAGFPDQMNVTFSVKVDGQYIVDLQNPNIWLLEDGRRIEPVTLSAPQPQPMTSIVVFDIDPQLEEQQFGMLPFVEFRDLVREAISQSHAGDVWIFCSTKLEELCLDPYFDVNRAYVDIHDKLSKGRGKDTSLSVVLRQSLKEADGTPQQKAIIIVKLRPFIGDGGIPYIPDALVTDLLLTETKIALVNLTHANDLSYPVFLEDMMARVDQINGHYFLNDYVENKLGEFIGESRTVIFQMTYSSRLFRDANTHTLVLGYENEYLSAWTQEEFYFPIPDHEPSLITYSSLQDWLIPADGLLSIFLIILLVGVIILSADDQEVTPRAPTDGSTVRGCIQNQTTEQNTSLITSEEDQA